MATRAELAAQLAAMERTTALNFTNAWNAMMAALDAGIRETDPGDGTAGAGLFTELSNFKRNIEGYKGTVDNMHARYNNVAVEPAPDNT